MFLLGKDNSLRALELGQITSSSAGSITELILRDRGKSDEITATLGTTRLLKFWPSALTEWPTKGVRDAFFSSPQLPRLMNPDTLKRTIADGVTKGDLGYAAKDSGGRLKLVKFKESMSEGEVEISDDVFVLKATDAVKLLEPPRLAALAVKPEHAAVKPDEQVAFVCAAHDQYGQPYPVAQVAWSATGGTISVEGVFTAGAVGAQLTVHQDERWQVAASSRTDI